MATTTIGTETGVPLASPKPTSGRGMGGLSSIILPLGLAFLVLAIWQIAVVVANIPSVILPSPISIGRYIIARYDILLTHAIPTTLESAAGFVLATVLGVALAILITYSRMAREALYPNLVFFQLIPKIALAPLFIIWLGVGAQSRVAFSIFIAFFP
ncbi:MAG: hypothetical protein ABW003_16575, partial [Microvirga sp.]